MKTKLKLDNFFINNTLPMAIINTELIVKAVNKSACNLLQLQEEELLELSLYDINSIGGITYNPIKMKQLLNGEIDSYNISRKYVRKDNTTSEGVLTVSRLKIDDEVYLSGIFNESKLIENENSFLEEDDNLTHFLLEKSPDIQYIFDYKNREYLYENSQLLHLLGYSEKDLKGENKWLFIREKVDYDSRVYFKGSYNYLLEIENPGEYTDVEFRVKCKDGKWLWLRERSTPIKFDAEGNMEICYTILQDVTEKRQIYEKVLDQQNFIEKIASITPDVIFVYEIDDLKNIYNNFKGRTFLGFSEAQWSEVKLSGLSNDEKTKIFNHLSKIKNLKDNEILEDELIYKGESGVLNWVLVKSKVFKRDENGKVIQVLSNLTDFTEYKKTLLKIKKSEETQRALLEGIPDLLFKVNKEGQYLEVIPNKLNDGYNPPLDDIIGKTFFEVLSTKNATFVKKHLDKAFEAQEIVSFELERKLNDKLFYLENHVSPVNEEEAVIIVRNITHKKRMQESIEEKVIELSTKNIELEKYISKNKELERFAYIVSHDLKEPLRTIKSFSEVLRSKFSKELKSEANTYIDFIISSTERLTKLVDGILNYSKLEKNEKVFETTDLNIIVKRVLKDLELVIVEKNASIKVEKLPELYCDPLQIRQLFQNLISNSIKFSRKGIAPEILLSAKDLKKKYLFTLQDNGIGIEDAFQEKAFSMFRQLNPRDKFDGQGIGLALCKRIIERHEGDIWIESDGKTGTTFYFSIPKPKSLLK